MSKRASMSWWFALGFGRRGVSAEHDHADMGTAFGLDASMETRPAHDDARVPDSDAGRPPVDGLGRRRAR